MATVKENKETITRSRLVGLKDICVAAVTTNDEDVYAAGVPVRLAKAIAATVKDTFSVEYAYSDDEVEDTVETYEKTEIELEVNRLTPGDYALLFDTLYKYGFLAKAEGDKAKEVALGFRAKQGNGAGTIAEKRNTRTLHTKRLRIKRQPKQLRLPSLSTPERKKIL